MSPSFQGSPQTKFGSEIRGRDQKNDIPGPGTYAVDNRIGKDSAAFSLKARPVDKNYERSPGPATYNPKIDYTKEDNGRTVFPKGSRNDGSNRNAKDPGPGQYGDLGSGFKPKPDHGWTFSKDGRGKQE